MSVDNLDQVLEIVTEFNKRYKNQNSNSANPYKSRVSEVKNSDEIPLSSVSKNIWIYSGYTWENLFNDGVYISKEHAGLKRRNILKQCDVMVDDRYIDSEKDITLKYRGSKNQRVIDVQQSLKQGKVVLFCD